MIKLISALMLAAATMAGAAAAAAPAQAQSNRVCPPDCGPSDTKKPGGG